MERLYVKLPDGTEHDFGAKNAKIAKSLPPVQKDLMIASLVIAEMAAKVGAGHVGEVREFQLHYEFREGETVAV